MFEFTELKPMVIAICIVVFSVLENVFAFYELQQNLFERISVNFLLGIVNSLIMNISVVVVLYWITTSHPFFSGMFSYFVIHEVWLLCLSFLFLDFYMYVWHRLMHTFPLGWRFHQVHHSDLAMNTSSGVRFHIIESFFSKLPQLFLIWFFGISLFHYFIYDLIFTIIVLFHHSNVALPQKIDKVLSYVIVTPNFHRVHHSQENHETHSNYSSVFTFWDRIFSSYAWRDKPEEIRIGLTKYPQRKTFIELLKMPFRD